MHVTKESVSSVTPVKCDGHQSNHRPTMVRIEEVQDETEKLRQQGLSTEKDDDDEWEATDADSDEVCFWFCQMTFYHFAQTYVLT